MELEQFGWNVLTFSFLGTIIFTFVEGWGYCQQTGKIWKTQSGKSVSVTMFAYMASMFLSFMAYGLTTDSIAASFNGGVLAALHVPILVGLWKYKGFTLANKWLLAGLALVLVLTVALPYKGEFFVALSFGSMIPLLAQPLEIIYHRDTGSFEPKMTLALMAGTAFWIVYGFAADDLPLKIICPTAMAIFVFTLVVAKRFQGIPKAP